MNYGECSQATKWQLSSHVELNSLRERANRRARLALSCDAHGSASVGRGAGGDVKLEEAPNKDGEGEDAPTNPCEVHGFADTRCDENGEHSANAQQLTQESDPDYGPTHTSGSRGNQPLLTPSDEATLITFYCSKIPLLIGPQATLPRCRRAAKVAATACLLFRRFYLSNSVMMHDPKSMLAAAAFLAAKVEDAMILVGYLCEGTKEMNAPVLMSDILDAEIRFIKGIDFDLLVFSPYKTVLSYTEDLRTFLKSEKGRGLITFPAQDGKQRQLVGEDLRPIHDAAMKICNDVIVSDIPMLFSPGEVGLAALLVANELVSKGGDESSSSVDMMGYIRLRFQGTVEATAIDVVTQRVTKLGQMIRELKGGKHGCGNYEANVNMDTLKSINKKLKKCRAWGELHKKESKRKKKKKRKVEA